MIIKSLQLYNYRCFKQLSIDFHPKLTVIVARNGQGKTTILDAVTVALGTFVGAFDNGKTRQIKVSDARYWQPYDQPESEQQFPVKISCALQQPDISATRELNGVKNKTTVKDAAQLTQYGKALMDQIRQFELTHLPVMALYGTSRLWVTHKNMERKRVLSESRSMGYEDCFSSASNYKQLQQWMAKATLAAIQKKEMPHYKDYPVSDQIEGIKSTVNQVLESENWSNFHYSFSDEELAMVHPVHGVLPVALLSDGVRAMVSLTADLAWRCAKLNPHLRAKAALKTEGIVLIDEVDMHLHPAWQQRVISSLQTAFPKIQFIVTTHSPQVLTTVAAEHIRVIQADETGISVHTPQFSSLAHESGDALAHIMATEPQPPLPLLEKVRQYEQYVRQGEEQNQTAQQLFNELEQAGYQFNDSDLTTWRFLANMKQQGATHG